MFWILIVFIMAVFASSNCSCGECHKENLVPHQNALTQQTSLSWIEAPFYDRLPSYHKAGILIEFPVLKEKTNSHHEDQAKVENPQMDSKKETIASELNENVVNETPGSVYLSEKKEVHNGIDDRSALPESSPVLLNQSNSSIQSHAFNYHIPETFSIAKTENAEHLISENEAIPTSFIISEQLVAEKMPNQSHSDNNPLLHSLPTYVHPRPFVAVGDTEHVPATTKECNEKKKKIAGTKDQKVKKEQGKKKLSKNGSDSLASTMALVTLVGLILIN